MASLLRPYIALDGCNMQAVWLPVPVLEVYLHVVGHSADCRGMRLRLDYLPSPDVCLAVLIHAEERALQVVAPAVWRLPADVRLHQADSGRHVPARHWLTLSQQQTASGSISIVHPRPTQGCRPVLWYQLIKALQLRPPADLSCGSHGCQGIVCQHAQDEDLLWMLGGPILHVALEALHPPLNPQLNVLACMTPGCLLARKAAQQDVQIVGQELIWQLVLLNALCVLQQLALRPPAGCFPVGSGIGWVALEAEVVQHARPQRIPQWLHLRVQYVVLQHMEADRLDPHDPLMHEPIPVVLRHISVCPAHVCWHADCGAALPHERPAGMRDDPPGALRLLPAILGEHGCPEICGNPVEYGVRNGEDEYVAVADIAQCGWDRGQSSATCYLRKLWPPLHQPAALMQHAVCQLQHCCAHLQVPAIEVRQDRLLRSPAVAGKSGCSAACALGTLEKAEAAGQEGCMAGEARCLLPHWCVAALRCEEDVVLHLTK